MTHLTLWSIILIAMPPLACAVLGGAFMWAYLNARRGLMALCVVGLGISLAFCVLGPIVFSTIATGTMRP